MFALDRDAEFRARGRKCRWRLRDEIFHPQLVQFVDGDLDGGLAGAGDDRAFEHPAVRSRRTYVRSAAVRLKPSERASYTGIVNNVSVRSCSTGE